MSIDHTTTFKRVLVPVDLSDDSHRAIATATQLFSGRQSSMTLLHVMEGSDMASEHPELRSQMVSTMLEDVQRRLLLLAGTYRPQWEDIDTLVEIGKPREVILAAAESTHADLVIMAARSRLSLSSALFGDTTYHVSRRLQCSVFVLKLAKA